MHDPLPRLKELHRKAYQMREQLEAIGDECCTLLGIDPSRMSTEADWCREIVEHGTAPEFTIAKLQAKQRS